MIELQVTKSISTGILMFYSIASRPDGSQIIHVTLNERTCASSKFFLKKCCVEMIL
jgi:hypothetical protein